MVIHNVQYDEIVQFLGLISYLTRETRELINSYTCTKTKSADSSFRIGDFIDH